MMEDKGSKGGRTGRMAEKAPAVAASRSTATAKAAAAAKPAAPKKAVAPRKAPATPVAAPAPAAARAAAPERAELVRMAAYFRAERRGFAPGYEVEDWLAAEAEVAAKAGPAAVAASGKSPSRKPSAG